MTLKECYEKLNGDYSDAVRRLGSEKLISKFMLMYKDDNSVVMLKKAVESGNINDCFIAAHTLKGVAGNLSFKKLAEIASELTEQLRPRPSEVDINLVNAVCEQHDLIIETINEYECLKE